VGKLKNNTAATIDNRSIAIFVENLYLVCGPAPVCVKKIQFCAVLCVIRIGVDGEIATRRRDRKNSLQKR
jgi:hypothetical protein